MWVATLHLFVSKGKMLVKKRLSSILERSHDSDGPNEAFDWIYLLVLGKKIRSDLNNEDEKPRITFNIRSAVS
jgi:hypothetical protein